MSTTSALAAKTSTASGYDAFISYSHAQDRPVAVELQSGFERFAKPWYRRRALRIFRDESSLSASPGLWPTIEEALDHSRFLILIASRDSARSRWVAREVEHWLDLGRRDQLLIVLTDGEILWEDCRFDWSRTDALPDALRAGFDEEPLYVDLRWARRADRVSSRDPRFREALATLAAPLHGCARDELIGEDLEQYRRTRRISRWAVATLSLLLIATVGATVVALIQRSEAQAQRDAAVHEAQLALGRQLVTETRLAPDDQVDLGLLLAAQAYALDPSPEQGAAAAQLLLRNPHLLGFLPDAAQATTIAMAPAGATLAVGDRSGRVTLWNAIDRTRVRMLENGLGALVTSIAFSGDGHRIIAGDEEGGVAVWDTTTGERRYGDDVHSRVASVALDTTGERFAVTSSADTRAGDVDGAVHTTQRFGDKQLKFDRNTLTGMSGDGVLTTWDLGTTAPMPGRTVANGLPVSSAVSPDFSLFAAVTNANPPYVIDTSTGTSVGELPLDTTAFSIDALAFDQRGATLAVASEGALQLWDPRTQIRNQVAVAGIPGHARAVTFGADDRVVAALGDRGITVWDLDATSPITHETQPTNTTALDDVPNALRASSAAFSRDGRLLAFTALGKEGTSAIIVWRLRRDQELIRFDGQQVIGFSPDGKQVASKPFNEPAPIVVADVDTGKTREVSKLPWKEPKQSRADQQRPVSASMPSDGVLRLVDTRRHQRILDLTVTGAPAASSLTFAPDGTRLAVTTAGGTFTIVHTDPASWRADACRIAARQLTRAELAHHVGHVKVPPACE